MNLFATGSIILQFADLPPSALESIECIDDTDLDRLASTSLEMGERDRTLIEVADACSADGSVMLLTDDETLVRETHEMATGLSDIEVSVWPEYSIKFMGNLHECGALPFDSLVAIAETESSYTVERGLPENLLGLKLARIKDTMNEAALREANHRNGSS